MVIMRWQRGSVVYGFCSDCNEFRESERMTKLDRGEMVKICSRQSRMAASSDEEAENDLRSLYGKIEM